MKKKIFSILLIFAIQHLYSQTQKVKNAEGEWLIVNIKPEEALEKALEEAKKDALRKAGVSERIKSTQSISAKESNKGSSEMFSMFSSIEMNGAVTEYDIKKSETEKSKIDGLLYAKVIIDATVKKYSTQSDSEFKIDVTGLRTTYRNEEAITFSVLPNKSGYLRIFLFEDNLIDAELLFPTKEEPDNKLIEKKSVKFPISSKVEYSVEKITSEEQEHNLLLFVYTKRDVPFYGKVSRQRVLNWINDMEPDEREVVMKAVIITE